jgi:hypothetical protein
MRNFVTPIIESRCAHSCKNQTVPYGTALWIGDVPGTSCQATIAPSLRDKARALRDGSLDWRCPRHFVPGYDRTVPPGQSPCPTGRFFWGGAIPGTSCQATIGPSLRDKARALRDGSFGVGCSRHFVPGYDWTVPPGLSSFLRALNLPTFLNLRHSPRPLTTDH